MGGPLTTFRDCVHDQIGPRPPNELTALYEHAYRDRSPVGGLSPV